MNTVAEDHHSAVRRSSTVSEASQDAQQQQQQQLPLQAEESNPLMRLVDAAVSVGAEETVISEEEMQEEKDEEDDDNIKVVVKGTVQDLVKTEKKQTFAEYLMEVINDEANHDVLQWMPCGTQFTITNHRKFTMERMPGLFKIRNMSSFVRKLTRWGFHRVHEKETGNSDIFRHELFLRDKPELCKKIRCVNRQQTMPPIHMSKASMMGPMGSAHMHMLGPDGESSRYHHHHHLPMVSPRRSMSSYARSPSMHRGYPPHPMSPYRAHVSPEYEKELIGKSAFRSSRASAAEYELEQILLQRQQARLMYATRPERHSPSYSLLDTSERSVSERSVAPLSSRDAVVEAALETLQRDGQYDLDMSPREAMLRAMLHKRQQQMQPRPPAPRGILRHGSSAYERPPMYYR
jgi:hypothetical protein